MMKYLFDSARFIDDGSGIFLGTMDQFNIWRKTVSDTVSKYGLKIKETDWSWAENNEYINFLDIKYKFDTEGNLVTDLHRKDTDSRGFLHFSSCHPNHVFSGIVYSQGVRYRRIISDDTTYRIRLEELKSDFKLSGYPERMLENIFKKLRTLPRQLEKQPNDDTPDSDTLEARVISTFGANRFLDKVVNEAEQILKSIDSKVVCKRIYRKGTSLRGMLSNAKNIGFYTKKDGVQPCGGKRCMSCELMLKDKTIKVNKQTVRLASGDCLTDNAIYLADCSICHKRYTGTFVRNRHWITDRRQKTLISMHLHFTFKRTTD